MTPMEKLIHTNLVLQALVTLHLSPFSSISGIPNRRETENSGFLVSVSQSVSNASHKSRSVSRPGKQCGLAGKSYFCALHISCFLGAGGRGRAAGK